MTGPEKEEMLRQRRLGFIGKVLPAFTREIPDHLATLQDSARRLAHLLEQITQETLEDKQKLADLLSAIERHLKIFSQKTQYLDRFGKRMGTLPCTFNPGEVVEEAVLFLTRLAHLRKVSLRVEVDQTSPSLYGDFTCVHFLVSIIIESMLERIGESGQVIVRACPSEKGLRISVAGQGTLVPISASRHEVENRYWAIGQELAADLGGDLQPTDPEHNTREFSLFLPTGIQELFN